MLDINLSGSIVEFFLNPSGYFMGFFDPYFPLFPTIALLLGAFILLCFPNNLQFSTIVAGLTAFAALGFSLLGDSHINKTFFNEMLAWNFRVALAQNFILVALCLSLLVALPFAQKAKRYGTEYFILLLFTAIGAIQMVMSRNLLALFLSIELLSLPLYVLCAFRKRDQRSREAGFKYFILGSFAAGLFLMGTAYLYGATGSFNFSEFALQNSTPLFLLGGVFLLAALSFKSALFPFHNWLPDVYEGAPSAVTGFMASAVKMAVFGVLIALVYEAKFLSAQEWQAPLKLFIVVSMTLANLAALKQRSVKRMLAYSSIAHVAYTFVALLSSTGDAAGFAVRAVLFYVVVYGFASLGIFAVLAYLDDEERTPFYFEKLNGLASKQPFVALSLALLLTSLAGIPPAAGFIGKFYLFSAALQSHHMDLVIAAIINSLISIYYYAKPVVGMYMLPASTSVTSSNATDQPMAMAIKIVIGICLLMTLLYGIAPSLLFRLTGSL